MEKKDIRSMLKAELISDFEAMGEKKFRADQVYKWVASGEKASMK